MSILTNLLKKAAPERYQLYQEHVRYEKAKQFHNLQVTNGCSNAQLKQEAERLTNLIRTTRDDRTRQNLQNIQAGIASELANKPKATTDNFQLSIGTHLRLWRQAAASFNAGFNRFSLAASLKTNVGNEIAGWLRAHDANGQALESSSLTDILPAPTMDREEALRTIEKHGLLTQTMNSNGRFNDFPGYKHVIDHSSLRAKAAREAFFKPLGEEGHRFSVASKSRIGNEPIEHTLIKAPAYGSVVLPPAVGSLNVNDPSIAPANKGDIVNFYRKEMMELLLRKDALESSANPDPVAITKLEERITDATYALNRHDFTIPTLETAKAIRAENEEIRARAQALFGNPTAPIDPNAPKNPADTLAVGSIDVAAGYNIIKDRPTSVVTAHSEEAAEPTYLDMSGKHGIGGIHGEVVASLQPVARSIKAIPAAPIAARAIDEQQKAVDRFKEIWRTTSGAPCIELDAAKANLKAIATEQFRQLAVEHPAQLETWRKNIQERFYGFKIELSNAHSAGDAPGYLNALTEVHIAQAEYDEATRLLLTNKIEHPAQAKFIAIYERQAAKVKSPVLSHAITQLRATAITHFAKTHERISADDARALLFEAKAKHTQLAITGTALYKERAELDAAGHTPHSQERIDLRSRGALYFAQACWHEEWLKFLESKI